MKKYLPLVFMLIILLITGCGPKEDPRRPRGEAAIASDMMDCKFFKENYGRYTIEQVSIVKRQTDEENKTDKIYVTASVLNGNENLENYTANTISGVIDFVVNYGLYNSGWILDSCEIDTSGENGYGVFTALSGRNMNEEQLMSDMYMGGSDENVEIVDYYCSPDMQYESYSLKHTDQKKYAIETWQNEISYSFVNNPSEYDEPGTWATASFLAYDEYEWHIDGKYVYDNRIVTIPYSEPQENMTLNRDGNDWSFSKLVSTDEISLRQLGESLDCEDEIAAGYSVGFWDGENYSELTGISYNDFNYIAVTGSRWPDVLLFGPDKIALLGNEGTVDNVGRKVYFEIVELERVDDSFVPILIPNLKNIEDVQYVKGLNKFDIFFDRTDTYYEYLFVSANTGTVAPFQGYDYLVSFFSCERAIIAKRQEDGTVKYGYVDETGKIAIPCQFESAAPFSPATKLAKVKINNKWGCINAAGDEIIPFIYDSIAMTNTINEMDKLIVESNGKKGIFDINGNEIKPPIYDSIDLMVPGMPIVAENNGKYCLLDRNGYELTSFEFDFYDYFGLNGLLAVGRNGKYGYVDIKGKTIIPLIYDHVGSFSNNRALVSKDGNWYVIDKSGATVFTYDYDDPGPNMWNFSRNVICVSKNGKYGLVDINGNIVVPLEYDDVDLYSPFCDLFFFKKDDMWGCFNSLGEIVVPVKYDWISWCSSDISPGEIACILVEKGEHTYLYKLTGELLVSLDNISFSDYYESSTSLLVFDSEKEYYGIINIDGEVVVPLEYDWIELVQNSDGRYFLARKGKVWGIIENPQWRQEG